MPTTYLRAQHGSEAMWRKHGCRCEVCAAGQRYRKIKHQKKRLQELIDDPMDPAHGTITGYQYKCRCDRCRTANAEYVPRRRRKSSGS